MTRASGRFAAGAAAALLVLAPAPAWPQLDQLLSGLGGASRGNGLSEQQIRTNPAARATDLLKQVFAKLESTPG